MEVTRLIRSIKHPVKSLHVFFPYVDNKFKISDRVRASDNGERLVVKGWETIRRSKDPSILAHIKRYEWAAQLLPKGLRLPDDGCGSGYGVRFLAEHGYGEVIGIDISFHALKYARKHYSGTKVNYVRMDGCHLGFNPRCIDVTVSFDTLEHIKEEDQERFVFEAARVLKPEGVLCIGTPNAQAAPNRNPHHLRELTMMEFQKLLLNRFKNVKMRGLGVFVNGVRRWDYYGKDLSKFNVELLPVEEDLEITRGLLAICRDTKQLH